MNGDELVSAVRDANGTELDRLGSEKALVAETAATLEPHAVLGAAGAAAARAAETFEAWAVDESDERVREAFADAADREREHYESIVAALDGDSGGAVGDPGDPDVDALHEHLRSLDGTVECVAAGLVGRPLVASRTLLQVVNFFINEGDTARTELFRDIRAETDALPETGATVLDEVCLTDDDWKHARESAEETIAVAYREYASTLEEMGLDPKPVC